MNEMPRQERGHGKQQPHLERELSNKDLDRVHKELKKILRTPQGRERLGSYSGRENAILECIEELKKARLASINREVAEGEGWRISEVNRALGLLSTPAYVRNVGRRRQKGERRTYRIYFRRNAAAPAGPPSPQVPSISLGNLYNLRGEVIGREGEVRQLQDAWDNRDIHVAQVVGVAGAGKSSVVKQWLDQMRSNDWLGAARVFGWSFDTRGTSEERPNGSAAGDALGEPGSAARVGPEMESRSPTDFIDAALPFLFAGSLPDTPPPPLTGHRPGGGTVESDEQRVDRLIRVIRAQRTLLVLDGLEALQHVDGVRKGDVKDTFLKKLLTELRENAGGGLCVLTTRIAVPALDECAPRQVRTIPLTRVPPAVGARILKSLGVTGPRQDLERASEECGGHCMAIRLLAGILRRSCARDVRRRHEIASPFDEKDLGDDAWRMMAWYDRGLGPPERSVLRLVALLGGSAADAPLDAVLGGGPVNGLTDALPTVRSVLDPAWQAAVSTLSEGDKFLERCIPPGGNGRDGPVSNYAGGAAVVRMLPLMREYFVRQVRVGTPAAWAEGNRRLYDFYRSGTEHRPTTLERIKPLFRAVAHGCAAGRHQEVLDVVYRDRIQHGEAFYCERTLGGFGEGLTALSHFFQKPWDEPVAELDEASKAFVLTEAGFSLRVQGRLGEALAPTRNAIDAWLRLQSLVDASRVAGHLALLYATLGDLSRAREHAEQGIAHARRTDDPDRLIVSRTNLARILHLSSADPTSARRLFEEAERIQHARQPGEAYLVELRGSYYCDLLLDLGEYEQVLKRAVRIGEIATTPARRVPLDEAFSRLAIGTARWLVGRRDGAVDLRQVEDDLNEAVQRFKDCGYLDYAPIGLLRRAEFYRSRPQPDLEQARSDIETASELAGRDSFAPMQLHQADCHLAHARLEFDQSHTESARAHFNAACEIIRIRGYHRRDAEARALVSKLGEGGPTRELQ